MKVDSGAAKSSATAALPTLDDVIAQVEKNVAPPVAEPEVVVEAPAESADGEKDAAELAVEAQVAQEQETAKQPEKKDPQAARFAALARRERELRQKAQDAESRIRAAEERARQAEEKERAISEKEARIKKVNNPLDLLKEHGFSYQDATQAVIGGYTPKEPDPVDVKLEERLNPVAQQVAELKAAQEQLNDALRQIQEHRVEVAKREVRQTIMEVAESGGYEYIKTLGDEAYELVENVIGEYYKKHKKLLPYNKACDTVEKYYDDRAQKLLSTQKVQSRLASSASQQTTTPSKQSPQSTKAKEPAKTLTNAHSTSAPRAKPDIDKLPKSQALEALASTLRYIKD